MRSHTAFTMRLVLVALAPAASSCGGEPDPPLLASNDWAGWVYLDEGGDLPVRARLSEEAPLVDIPHVERFGLPASLTRTADGGLILETTIGETPLRLDASGHLDASGAAGATTQARAAGTTIQKRATGTTIQGRATLGDARGGDFWLHRSALPLDRGEPEGRTACTGTYRFPSGRTVIVSRRAWNELRYLDLASGDEGTLFATSDSTFFAGAAEYVPTEVVLQATCRVRADGSVRLEWAVSGEDPETGVPARLAEREVTFTSEGASLAGTVLLPESDVPVPGVVLLGGSNWGERGSVRVDAELIAAAGVAVLIYDKRGHGESGGEAVVPFALSAADARAAAGALRALPEVREDIVGAAGRSRGGWFAPLAAAEPGALDFVLLLVPAGDSPAEQETYRRLAALEARGASRGELREAREYLELMYAWVATGRGWEAYRAALDGISDEWFEVLGGADDPDPGIWRWDTLNAHFEPFPIWERVSVPVLALFGEEDRSVDTDVGVARIGAALARGGNSAVELVVVPGVDHSLRRGPELPLHLRPGYGPEIWSTVHRWLRSLGDSEDGRGG